MGEMYTVSFTGVSVSAAQDVFEISPASTKPVRIHAVWLGQSSDMGDAQAEALQITIKRGATSSGSGGSAPTPAALNPSAAAASFAAEVNNTTQASGGTIVTLHSDCWVEQVPYIFVPSPECRPECAASSRIVVTLSAPADAITMSGTIYVEEIG